MALLIFHKINFSPAWYMELRQLPDPAYAAWRETTQTFFCLNQDSPDFRIKGF
jgi:hypothetical protein